MHQLRRAAGPRVVVPGPFAFLIAALLSVTAARASGQPPRGGEWWMGDSAPLFAEALELAGLEPNGFRFDQAVVDLWGGDRWRLPLFNLFFTDPWSISPYAREQAANARRSAERTHDLLYLAQAATGVRVRDNYYGSFLTEAKAAVEADGELALARALEELGAGDAASIGNREDYRAVPVVARNAAALVLRAAADAEMYRRIGLLEPLAAEGISLEWAYARAFDECFWRAADDDDANLERSAKFDELRRMLRTEQALDSVDRHTFARGANLIALAVDSAERDLAATGPFDEVTCDFSIKTDLGRVRIAGSGAHVFGADDTHLLLAIDLAGDDRWFAGGASGDAETEPIGVAIDVAGDDRYETASYAAWRERNENGPRGGEEGFRQEVPSGHAPEFGAGVLGYGFLVDLSGDDVYLAPIASLGCGLLGHGALLDRAGNDIYRGDAGCIGSGTFGTGVLADHAGDDAYALFHKGMGYGGTLGAGVLVDLAGNDAYVAETERVKYSWFDNFGTQLNMTQGFGYGRRADMDDGHSWSGGVGMLVDGGGGDDHYHCGIYGIGCAYWFALGMLHDDGGDDRYISDSYSIASPPHFAVGIVIDESGDDEWRGRSSRACGFGRDFSIGWFEECAGDDLYICSDSAFGIGNVNGLGLCWDKGGNDIWCARSNSFAQPYVESEGTRRSLPINAGLFIDAAGTDRYLRIPDGVVTWDVERADLEALVPWDFLFDGARHHWRDHIDQPGSTGAAIDGNVGDRDRPAVTAPD